MTPQESVRLTFQMSRACGPRERTEDVGSIWKIGGCHHSEFNCVQADASERSPRGLCHSVRLAPQIVRKQRQPCSYAYAAFVPAGTHTIPAQARDVRLQL